MIAFYIVFHLGPQKGGCCLLKRFFFSSFFCVAILCLNFFFFCTLNCKKWNTLCNKQPIYGLSLCFLSDCNCNFWQNSIDIYQIVMKLTWHKSIELNCQKKQSLQGRCIFIFKFNLRVLILFSCKGQTCNCGLVFYGSDFTITKKVFNL